jgi:hypothetical protein
MKLIDVSKAFATDEQSLAYLEAMRWPYVVRPSASGAVSLPPFRPSVASRWTRESK